MHIWETGRAGNLPKQLWPMGTDSMTLVPAPTSESAPWDDAFSFRARSTRPPRATSNRCYPPFPRFPGVPLSSSVSQLRRGLGNCHTPTFPSIRCPRGTSHSRATASNPMGYHRPMTLHYCPRITSHTRGRRHNSRASSWPGSRRRTPPPPPSRYHGRYSASQSTAPRIP